LVKFIFMEPVITVEGYKVLQNPEESRSLLSAYYETLGFHIINNPESSATSKIPEAQSSIQSAQARS
jgi:hypothetical protein